MEGVKCFVDDYGFAYDVVSTYKSGYSILYQTNASPCPWVIRAPDGVMTRFKTENELWQYALDKKLFKRKDKKHGNR